MILERKLKCIEATLEGRKALKQIMKDQMREPRPFKKVFFEILEANSLDDLFLIYRELEHECKTSEPWSPVSGDPTPWVYMVKYIEENDHRGFLAVIDHLLKEGYLRRLYIWGQCVAAAPYVDYYGDAIEDIELILDDPDELEKILVEVGSCLRMALSSGGMAMN